ncbi:hypothetical protein Pan216_11050 [Planctomycetes bacterium Pan216]|uniref:Carboxypeptidase regulatory-like domain-containing protein n=1 Tax=Kolteria novifilia TaxID=2527975 RepID=A0A518AZW6_9BACT|nr:hypothetical protein Pan216_11050 [Planctomycetes bacterium Pan216]
MFTNQIQAAVASLAFIALVAGCGDGNQRQGVEVHGDVTLDGNPVSEGTIELIPLDGGVAAGASISNGTYRIEAKKGPRPGQYTAEVRSTIATGRMIPGTLGEESIEERVSIVPARYNEASELRLTIDDADEDRHDFRLTSQPQAER